MTRAERRRLERQKSKRNATPTKDAPRIGTDQIYFNELKQKISKTVDAELYEKCYAIASKDAVDCLYEIVLGSIALALHDNFPRWTATGISKILSLVMQKVDAYTLEGWKNKDNNVAAWLDHVEEVTGVKLTIDSVPEKQKAV